jgi:hypothetical protein
VEEELRGPSALVSSEATRRDARQSGSGTCSGVCPRRAFVSLHHPPGAQRLTRPNLRASSTGACIHGRRAPACGTKRSSLIFSLFAAARVSLTQAGAPHCSAGISPKKTSASVWRRTLLYTHISPCERRANAGGPAEGGVERLLGEEDPGVAPPAVEAVLEVAHAVDRALHGAAARDHEQRRVLARHGQPRVRRRVDVVRVRDEPARWGGVQRVGGRGEDAPVGLRGRGEGEVEGYLGRVSGSLY